MQQAQPPPREVVLEQLERMLASDTFAGAERSRVLLRFLVEQAVENQSDRLKEYTIGSEALGRGDSFDPRTDPIVRAEASRLRSRVERYYTTNGVADTVLITLPKGSYVPQFQRRVIPEAAPVAGAAGGSLSTGGLFQRFIWFLLGGLTVGAAVTLVVWVRGRQTPTPELGEIEIIDIDLGSADRSLGSDFGNDVILSPDGTRIVFVALGSDHVPHLMTRKLGQRTIVGLEGTDGARAPFFSPDSRWVGFWADAKLKKVPVDGGSPPSAHCCCQLRRCQLGRPLLTGKTLAAPVSIETDDRGKFAISLSPGLYHVSAVAAGFKPSSNELELRASGATLDISLQLDTLSDQVTVTATRAGSADIQTTGVSITALDTKTLDQASVERVDHLAGLVPTLSVSQTPGGTPLLTLRGIGSNAVVPGSDANVTMQIDGVYLAQGSALALDFLDVERVEVLRGPQGTLFGRNSIGGTINIVTRQPTNTLETRARLTAGNYDKLRAEGAISGPLVRNTVMGSFAFLRGSRDGFVVNVDHPAHPLGSEDTWAGRGQLRIVLGSRHELLVSGDYSSARGVPLTLARPLAAGPIAPPAPRFTSFSPPPSGRCLSAATSLGRAACFFHRSMTPCSRKRPMHWFMHGLRSCRAAAAGKRQCTCVTLAVRST